jgi:hypothetical protein
MQNKRFEVRPAGVRIRMIRDSSDVAQRSCDLTRAYCNLRYDIAHTNLVSILFLSWMPGSSWSTYSVSSLPRLIIYLPMMLTVDNSLSSWDMYGQSVKLP